MRRGRVPRGEPDHRAARRPGRVRDVRGRQHRPAAARRQASAHRLRARRSSTSTPTKVARYVAERAADAARYRTPLHRAVQTIADVGDPRRSAGQLRETATQRELLRGPRRDDGRGDRPGAAPRAEGRPARRPPRCSTRTSTSSSRRPGRTPSCVQWESFTAALERVDRPGHPPDPHLGAGPVRAHRSIERNLAWYLLNGRLSTRARPHRDVVHRPAAGPAAPARAGPGRRVRLRARRTCARRSRRAPRQDRQDEARAYYRAQRASGDAPVPEKHHR